MLHQQNNKSVCSPPHSENMFHVLLIVHYSHFFLVCFKEFGHFLTVSDFQCFSDGRALFNQSSVKFELLRLQHPCLSPFEHSIFNSFFFL